MSQQTVLPTFVPSQTNTATMNIPVTGSLGHISKPLTGELVQKGHTVTVISSNPNRQPAIEAAGATAAIGSTGFILGSHDVERMLNALADAAITHLRPGSFYYNLYSFADMINGAGMIGTNYGGNDKIVWVHPDDIAAVAAEELAAPATGQRVRYIASDERTATETAQALGAAIGKPDLQWLTFSDGQTKAGLEQNGIPAHIAASFVELGASIHSGALREDYDRHKPAAMGKVKLADFATEFAAAFNKE